MQQVTEIQYFPGRGWKACTSTNGPTISRDELADLTLEHVGTNNLMAYLGAPLNTGQCTGYGHIGSLCSQGSYKKQLHSLTEKQPKLLHTVYVSDN